MASTNAHRRQFRDAALIQAAAGRCACTGQCGHNHAWGKKEHARRCRAPHGVNIVRQRDNPSCWRPAPLQGFISSKNPSVDMKGPRTHEAGKFVQRGIAVGDLAHAELFDVDRISQVWLSATERVVMCQFCARHYRALRE